MSYYYNTNLAAAIILESARHAVRLGIEGTITLYGETIPQPERHEIGADGEEVTLSAVPAEDRELELSPAEWVKHLEPLAEDGDFERLPSLAGVRWEVPIGQPVASTGADRRWARGLCTIPVRRSVECTPRHLTEGERAALLECQHEPSDWRRPYPAWRAADSNADARADWERLPFVQKMQDEIKGQVPALLARGDDWADLLTNRLGVASDVKAVRGEWIATLDGFKLVLRLDYWWMAWIATTAPMVGSGEDLFSIFCGDWEDPAPDLEDTPTARRLLSLSVRPRHAGPLPLVEPERLQLVVEAARSVGAPASPDGVDFDRLALEGGDEAQRLESRCRRLGLIEAAQAPRWLIPGLLPAGEIVLLVGEAGIGKSAVAQELAVTLAREGQDDSGNWLAYPVDPAAAGGVAYLDFEGSEPQFNEREAAMDPEGFARARLEPEFGITPDRLAGVLDQFRALPRDRQPRLVIIDSLRASMVGSENNDGDVKPYMDLLHGFVRSTGCTVMVIHHLNKGSKRARQTIESADDLRGRVSGHTTLVSRPRLVLGMFRDAKAPGITRIGVIKQNLGMHNAEGVMRPYRPDSWRHVLVEEADALALREPARMAERASAPAREPAEDEAAILAALADLRASGQKVTKTGPKSLFSSKNQKVSGIPRARIDAIVESLLASVASRTAVRA